MSHNDTSITSYVFPQDGGTGTSDSEADWTNAVYFGGIAQAEAINYAPYGLNITADYGAETFDVSEGIAYIRDTRQATFRTPADNEENRSGTWNVGILSSVMVPGETGISFATSTGVNHIWIYYNQSGQNDAYIRVADTDADAPTDGGLKLGTIDAGAQSITELNRVAGQAWTFAGFRNVTSMVSDITLTPDVVFDEMVLKAHKVTGDATSAYILKMTVNGVTSGGYAYRTTQGNATGSDIYMQHVVPANARVQGDVVMSGKFPDNIWSFRNLLGGGNSKYVAFYGNHDSMSGTELSSVNLFWDSGNIQGYFELWGRNYVGF